MKGSSALIPTFGGLVLLGAVGLSAPCEARAQLPPARLEIRVTPAVEGLVVEALGFDLLRVTDAAGVAVLPLPPGLVEIEVRAPTGESTRSRMVVRSGGQIEEIEIPALTERLDAESSAGDEVASSPGDSTVDPDPIEPAEGESASVFDQIPEGATDSGPDDRATAATEDGPAPEPDPEPSEAGGADASPTAHPLVTLLPWVVAILALPAVGGGILLIRRRRIPAPDEPTRVWTPGPRGDGTAGGEPFGDFLLHEVIGRGGMATVWRGSTAEGEPLAVKIMNPELATDPELRRKFLREGAVLERIQESWPEAPIVRIQAWGPDPAAETAEPGTTEAPPWVAMEYLEGPTLLQHVRSKSEPFSSEGVVRLGVQVARGLRAAHDCGIYHRDLAPDNLLLLSAEPDRPVVRLIDFGVARHEFTQIHTLDGSIFGKPPYMAPEQGGGLAVDGRADLYSLGVILYLLLEGRTPFTDPNPLVVLQMHAESPVPPLSDRHPRELVRLVADLLEKDPDRRLPDANELLARLRDLLASTSTPATSPGTIE